MSELSSLFPYPFHGSCLCRDFQAVGCLLILEVFHCCFGIRYFRQNIEENGVGDGMFLQTLLSWKKKNIERTWPDSLCY